MTTNGLPIEKRRRVAALARESGERFEALLAAETDMDVLRELNFQFSRQPRMPRTAALAARLQALTGRKPRSGLSGFQRWYGRRGPVAGMEVPS